MTVTSGYGLTNLSDTVTLNLNKSQGRLQSDVSKLSSGLRINSAADDPSGLAIAEGLQAKVNGYDQGARNVQDATNTLTVADGALQTVTDILQRLRSLAVEANDDLLSDSDRADLQTELDQLKHEVDSIAQNTNFNGVSLLNGTDAYGIAAGPPVQNNTFATPSVGTGPNAYEDTPPNASWDFTGGSGIAAFGSTNIWTNDNYPNAPPSGAQQVAYLHYGSGISQTVPGLSGGQYAITFNVAQRGRTALGSPLGNLNEASQDFNVLVDGTVIAHYDPIPADYYNPGWTSIITPSFVPATVAPTISFESLDTAGGDNTCFIDNVNIVAITTGKTLNIQGGADEGNVIAAGLPSVTSSNLGISDASFSSSANAALSEGSLDSALQIVGTGRANLGAQMVRLQEQAANDNTASVNLTGSESNIRDLNVAQATTAYTAEQIISSIGTSILGNIKTMAASVEKLFQ